MWILGTATRPAHIKDLIPDFDYVTTMMCQQEMDYRSRHRIIAGCLKIAHIEQESLDVRMRIPWIDGIEETMLVTGQKQRHRAAQSLEI